MLGKHCPHKTTASHTKGQGPDYTPGPQGAQLSRPCPPCTSPRIRPKFSQHRPRGMLAHCPWHTPPQFPTFAPGWAPLQSPRVHTSCLPGCSSALPTVRTGTHRLYTAGMVHSSATAKVMPPSVGSAVCHFSMFRFISKSKSHVSTFILK